MLRTLCSSLAAGDNGATEPLRAPPAAAPGPLWAVLAYPEPLYCCTCVDISPLPPTNPVWPDAYSGSKSENALRLVTTDGGDDSPKDVIPCVSRDVNPGAQACETVAAHHRAKLIRKWIAPGSYS